MWLLDESLCEMKYSTKLYYSWMNNLQQYGLNESKQRLCRCYVMWEKRKASPPSAGWSHGRADTFLCLEGPSCRSFPCLSSACDRLLWAFKERKKERWWLLARQAKQRWKKVSYLEDFDLAAGRMDMLHVFPVFIGGKRVHLDTEGHPFLATMLPGGELGADAVNLRRWGERWQKCVACVVFTTPQPLNPHNKHLTWVDHYLDEDRRILDWIPEKLNSVEVQRVWTGLQYPHWQRNICKEVHHLLLCQKHFRLWQISSFIVRFTDKSPPCSETELWVCQLTYIQDSVSGPVPPPTLHLLVLHILQSAFMKYHSHNAL